MNKTLYNESDKNMVIRGTWLVRFPYSDYSGTNDRKSSEWGTVREELPYWIGKTIKRLLIGTLVPHVEFLVIPKRKKNSKILCTKCKKLCYDYLVNGKGVKSCHYFKAHNE